MGELVTDFREMIGGFNRHKNENQFNENGFIEEAPINYPINYLDGNRMKWRDQIKSLIPKNQTQLNGDKNKLTQSVKNVFTSLNNNVLQTKFSMVSNS